MHWFLDPILKHYADFNGRASRREYWMFSLVFFLVAICGGLSLVFLTSLIHELLFSFAVFLLVVLILATVIPSIALSVRRLHDIGLPGYWFFLGFLPYVGEVIIIIFAIIPSQKGTNKYGPNPYEIQPPLEPVASASSELVVEQPQVTDTQKVS